MIESILNQKAIYLPLPKSRYSRNNRYCISAILYPRLARECLVACKGYDFEVIVVAGFPVTERAGKLAHTYSPDLQIRPISYRLKSCEGS